MHSFLSPHSCLELWEKRAQVGIIFLRTICSSAHPLQRNRPSQTGGGGSWPDRTPAPSQLWLWVSFWLQCDVFFLIFFSFFQKGGSGFGIGPFTFFVNKFHRYSWFFASTVETCSHYNLWSISLYYCKGLATAFILLLSYILSGATYDRVRPSLFVSITFILFS